MDFGTFIHILICILVDRGCKSGVGCNESVQEEGAGMARREHETEIRTKLLERVEPLRGHGGSCEYITHSLKPRVCRLMFMM